MRRRDFITLFGGATAWPLAARAQPLRRIGLLLGLAENDPEGPARIAAFREGLAALGWTEARNIRIDIRFAGGDFDRIREHAAEMVAASPTLIVAHSTPVVAALKQAATGIPIIFAAVNDPVGQGFVANLANPGGNITGFTFIHFEMVGKWLVQLKEIAPGVVRTGLMFNPDLAPYFHDYLREFAASRPNVPVEITAAPVHDKAEIEATIARLAGAPGSGLIAAPDPFIIAKRDVIMRSVAQHRVPAVYALRRAVIEGALMSYGPDPSDIFRRAADYVDRILKGANPRDLPVQQPTKFELIINLKTAKALGLVVPLHLQQLADEVIE